MNRPDADSGERIVVPENISRRDWLRKTAWTAGAAALGGASFGLVGLPARADDGKLKQLKLSWNAGSICTAPVPVAVKQGFFAKRGLDVELINFAGSTDQLLEAIATGKSDAGVGMALHCNSRVGLQQLLHLHRVGLPNRFHAVRLHAGLVGQSRPRSGSGGGESGALDFGGGLGWNCAVAGDPQPHLP